MASTTLSSPPITTETTVIQLHSKTHFPIKLVSTNFAIWQRQVRSTLIGLDLLGYIDGTMVAPTMTIDDSSNPCYSIWYRQDQSIVGALLGSCADVVQPLISNADTARAAWMSLHSAFASASRGRVVSLKSKLGKNPRGDRAMSDYLFDMRSIANELALIQNPVSEEDLVVHVLNQVGDDYDSISSAALLRPTSISFTELGDILTDHERKLQTANAAKSTIVATANYTQNYGAGRTSMPHRDGNNGRRGRNAGHGGQRPTCQQSGCRFCDIPGHDVKECRKLSKFLRTHGISSQPTVHSTMAASPGPQWLFDSGASHHTTPTTQSLQSFSDYGGPDEIRLGNGSENGGETSHRG